MKLFYSLVILIIFQNCSFDNKTGIWKNENTISKKDKSTFSDFETLSVSKKPFKKSINIKKNFVFSIPNETKKNNWEDIFYNNTNNFENFYYTDSKKIIFKGKKITKYNVNKRILLENDNIVTTDLKGNILIFSIIDNEVIDKFNFYKKKYKNIDKSLNLIIEDNIIYASDNIGYSYAYNYKIKKIIWAKNFKVPFRSNLKILKNKLVASNQNNDLLFINKNNGEIIKLIPTEETLIKNEFINNLSANNKYLFYLNNYGSIYAIDQNKLQIVWYLNINKSLDPIVNNLFVGSEIINHKDRLVLSSNDFMYILNANDGSIIYKNDISFLIKPLAISDYIFVINKENFLICINLTDGKIIYSHDLNKKIAEFLDTKKKIADFRNLFMANKKLYIFLENSYYIKFNIKGEIEEINKLPSKLNADPIFSDGSIVFLDKKNKIYIID
jgi:outer membrane protein assembly factor BamB